MRLHEISPSRQKELEKLAARPEQIQEVMETASPARSTAIQQLARRALGLMPERDITDLELSTQDELLFVMRTMRDIVFPPQPDDTI